jgi:hypothetical protein
MPSSDPITITSGSCPFAPRDSSVDENGTVIFMGRSGSVTTCINGVVTSIFTSGSPPYTVPKSYQLNSNFTGIVTLHFDAGGACDGNDPANGTLRVGSTSDDDDGDGSGGDHHE